VTKELDPITTLWPANSLAGLASLKVGIERADPPRLLRIAFIPTFIRSVCFLDRALCRPVIFWGDITDNGNVVKGIGASERWRQKLIAQKVISETWLTDGNVHVVADNDHAQSSMGKNTVIRAWSARYELASSRRHIFASQESFFESNAHRGIAPVAAPTR
jgi:hypothetical protein